MELRHWRPWGCDRTGQLVGSDNKDVLWRSQCDVVHRQEYEMDGDHLEKKNTKRETKERRVRERTDPVLVVCN